MRARIGRFAVSALILSLCIAYVALFSIFLPSVKAQSDLVLNGDFNEALQGSWRVSKVVTASMFPRIERWQESDGNFYLHFDTPSGTEAYVEQGPISIPAASKVVLKFVVWGAYEPTSVDVEVVHESGFPEVVSSFAPGGLEMLNGIRATRTLDLTQFSGRSIGLRFRSSSPYNLGTFTNLDDIRLLVPTSSEPIVTCEVTGSPEVPETTVIVGQKVTVKGVVQQLSPSLLRVEYLSPSGQMALQQTVRPDSLGVFSHEFSPTRAGVWAVRALPAKADSDHYLGSCEVQFPVAGSPGVELVDVMMNGRRIDSSNPLIEVKPGGQISGTIKIRAFESLRFTNVVVVGFNTWEPNVWDLVIFERGLIDDPSGLGIKDAYLFSKSGISLTYVPRDRDVGLYAVNSTWTLPIQSSVPNEAPGSGNNFYLASGHPSMKVPEQAGEYFLVIAQVSDNTATRALGDIRAFSRSDWQQFTLSEREPATIMAIKVIVVDVDPHMERAADAISCVRRFGVNAAEAQELYSKALAAYSVGHYNIAATLADEAAERGEAEARPYANEFLSGMPYLSLLAGLSQSVVSPGARAQTVNINFANLVELSSEGEYCRAAVLADNLVRDASFDILVYSAYFAALWIGIGDIGSHLVGKREPAKLVSKWLRTRLGRRVEGLHRDLLAAIAIYGLSQLAIEIVFSQYPNLGSIFLAAAVVGGWKFPVSPRLKKYLK